MARGVNVFFGQPTATGTNVSVPVYTLDVRFDWTDGAGQAHTDTRTVTFPQVLAQIPPARLLEVMKDLIVERARTLAGVDS